MTVGLTVCTFRGVFVLASPCNYLRVIDLLFLRLLLSQNYNTSFLREGTPDTNK